MIKFLILAVGIIVFYAIYRKIKGLNKYPDILSVSEKAVLSGSGNNIGKRGIAIYNNTITENEIVQFYNEVIKNSNYNYYTLLLRNRENYGFTFIGCQPFGNIGIMDKQGAVIKKEKSFMIKNNKIIYD